MEKGMHTVAEKLGVLCAPFSPYGVIWVSVTQSIDIWVNKYIPVVLGWTHLKHNLNLFGYGMSGRPIYIYYIYMHPYALLSMEHVQCSYRALLGWFIILPYSRAGTWFRLYTMAQMLLPHGMRGNWDRTHHTFHCHILSSIYLAAICETHRKIKTNSDRENKHTDDKTSATVTRKWSSFCLI